MNNRAYMSDDPEFAKHLEIYADRLDSLNLLWLAKASPVAGGENDGKFYAKFRYTPPVGFEKKVMAEGSSWPEVFESVLQQAEVLKCTTN